MNKSIKHLGSFLLVFAMLVLTLSCVVPDKAKILIIGDSISIGYTPYVKQELEKKAEVFHNPGNAQHTGTGLEKIEEWVGDNSWDIIQFNWGLWDLCYRHPDSKVQGNRDKVNGDITFELEDYRKNLESIVLKLKEKTDARLIFVATTYVPENEAGRFQDDAIKYNAVAKDIMKKHSIIINDVFQKSKEIHLEFGKGNDDVHYTEEGYKRLGSVIAQFLESNLQ
jgi:lysophospholipase L1-like esterase